MRLIDAEKLEKVLKDYYKPDYNQPYGGMSADAVAAMSAIDNAPTINAEPVQQGWICVKDRLPDLLGLHDGEVEYVLVYEKGVLVGFHDYENVSVCAYGKDGWDEYDSFGLIDVNNITHWMPYPKPLSAKMDGGMVDD